MATYDLTAAQARLDAYLAAELAVLSGQSYRIGDRELKRADLEAIRAGIKDCQASVNSFSAPYGSRRRVIVPAS